VNSIHPECFVLFKNFSSESLQIFRKEAIFFETNNNSMELTNTAKEKTLKLGFLGMGWMGKNRMEAIIRSGLGIPVLMADSNIALFDDLRKQYPGVEISENLRYDTELDGIVIATPSALHAVQAVDALNNGLPVFCQKPLAKTLEETEKVVNTAREKNLLLGVDFSYRYTKAFQKLQEVVKGGEIGEVFSAGLSFHNAYGPDKPWAYNPELSGGGCIIDLGIHLVDMLLLLTDFPEAIKAESYLYSKGKSVKDQNTVEDFALAGIHFSNGISASLNCSWNNSIGQDAVIEVILYGTKGSVSFKNINGSFLDFSAELSKGTWKEILVSPPDDWMGKAAVEWTRRLLSDNSFDNDAYQFVKTAKIIDMIYGRYFE
jgi:predicted dehydrogenase